MGNSLTKSPEENRNYEIYSLIWLDASMNISRDNVQIRKQLQSLINHVITFENEQQCRKYLQSVSNDDRIVFIVSGTFGQNIVPHIHHLRQVTSIYVFCFDIKFHQQWAKDYPKIKNVCSNIKELINQIKSDLNQRQHSKIDEALPINILNSNTNSEGQSTSDLNGEFLHSQLLIDCLIRMKTNPNDRNEFILFSRQLYQDNKWELNILKEFEKTYSSERALWWYTRQSFLYRLLNKALRVQNIDLLYLFRFFIRDLQQQLETNKCTTSICAYRAQLISKDELEILRNSLGKIISVNSFLSTSLDSQRARSFFLTTDTSNDTEAIFFEINADPRLENTKSFSNISSFSCLSGEQEILFMIGSIFRLNEIRKTSDGVWTIGMSLCSFNDDPQLQSLYKHMKNELGTGETNLLKFGKILTDMGQFDHAEKYILQSLNQLPRVHENTGSCYFELGNIALEKGIYDTSLEWYKKSLDIRERTLQPYDPRIASLHGNIANIYKKKGDYILALESYNKALRIYERMSDANQSGIANCWHNMGIVHRKDKNYVEALKCYEKALVIREKCLPANHYQLGGSHNNIGGVQISLGNADLALEHFQKSLNIYAKSHPSQHPDIAETLKNIAIVYEGKNEFEQALSFYEKAAAMYRRLFPSTHPDVIQIEEDIENIQEQFVLVL